MTAVLGWAAENQGPWAALCLAGSGLLTVGVMGGAYAIAARWWS